MRGARATLCAVSHICFARRKAAAARAPEAISRMAQALCLRRARQPCRADAVASTFSKAPDLSSGSRIPAV